MITCKLDKMTEGENGKFARLENARIHAVGTPTASTITARYYKGASGHGDNLVIEVDKCK